MNLFGDDEIRARLRAADASALELIYDRFARSLHAYAAALVGCERADDVVQDVLVAVAERRERVAVADDLAGYLLRMARNRALDVLRRDRTRSRVAEPAKAHNLASDDTATVVAAALAQLPIEQREVVALKIDAGLTFAAIATALLVVFFAIVSMLVMMMMR